jgi:hypothetical protein
MWNLEFRRMLGLFLVLNYEQDDNGDRLTDITEKKET